MRDLAVDSCNNDEDQASNSKKCEWNDDGGGGSTDANTSNVAVEDDDDRSESWESDNSHFSQISSIEPQGEPELLQFS